jgi:hypothetical protein
MNNSGTTEISNLPLSPQVPQLPQVPQNQGQANPENIKIANYDQDNVIENTNSSATQQQSYNQFVSGIQQASAAGALNLPSRDIPQSTTSILQDEQIKPNFIPQDSQTDYIANHDTTQDIIRNNRNEQDTMDSLERLYQEFQIPVLIAIMYFIYQLPAVRVYLHKIIPSLFSKDGNPNLYGYIFNSIFFGLIYYFMLKLLRHFTEM